MKIAYHHGFLGDNHLVLHGNDNAVEYISYSNEPNVAQYSDNIGPAAKDCITWLDHYFNRASCESLTPHFTQGTELQRRVWQRIHAIPYGTTISYTTLARDVGSPNAVRAAASACGKNPLPLLVPCHRVIGKDGSLGGFAWGLDIKRRLLAHEHIKIDK